MAAIVKRTTEAWNRNQIARLVTKEILQSAAQEVIAIHSLDFDLLRTQGGWT